jgi:pilus assembly protein CpaE
VTTPADEIRLLLVEDVPQVAQYVRSLIDTQTKVKLLDVVTDGRAVVDQIRELGPDVVVVDVLLQGKVGGLQVVQTMREAGIELPIICLTVPQQPVTIGEGMGTVRIVSMPFSGYDFMHAVNEVHKEHRANDPESQSRIFSLYGAKGGVGTTTLAYNLAAAMRTTGLRVALVDGSLQFGDLRALLHAPETAPSILQLPITHAQKADLAEVVYRDRSGVDVLLAPPRIEMAEMITGRDLERLMSLMRKMYNVVIIDTASAVDESLLAFLDASDFMIQVVSYESTALQQASAMATTLDAIGYARGKIRYLVNRADSTGGMSRDAIKQRFGRPADYEVVSDGRLVVESNNRGEPFVMLAPDAPVSRDIQRIAQHLTGVAASAPVPVQLRPMMEPALA